MASQAQIEANRRNAQKSTGPKTEEGKAAVARNAVKHGLFCQFLILPGELEDELETLRQGIYKRLRPADELEKLYVERIVVAAWKIRRLLSCDPHCYELDRTPYRSLENAADMVRRDIEQQEQFQKLITSWNARWTGRWWS